MILLIETHTPTEIRDARPTEEAVVEFAAAMDAYKRRSGRPFPTWSEVLEVLRSLGYTRLDASEGDPAVRYRVRLTLGGAEAAAIGRELRHLNGTPVPAGPARDFGVRDFGFRSESERDAALRSIRRRYGWTTVEAVD